MVGTNISTNENSSYLRRIRKPMIEKKRRDRMNQSIEMLKTIKKQTMPMTRIDKADILELTVFHLTKSQQQQRSVALATEVAAYNKGFKDCARTAVNYLQAKSNVPDYAISGLNQHLHQTYLSRDHDVRSYPRSQQYNHSSDHLHMHNTDHTIKPPQVNRISTPLRDAQLGYVKQSMNTPTFSPIVDMNTSLPHLSASFVTSSLGSTPNSSTSSHSAMSISNSSSTSALTDESYPSSRNVSHDTNSSTSYDVVTIGNKEEDTVGHVIKETTWRPW
ncbi:oxysterol-binding protein hes1 [Mactra antiquata]